MRVLMFGLEFPPFMSGGLGTASYDMTKALAQNGVKIRFIQPQVRGLEKIHVEDGLGLRSASGTRAKNSVIRKRVDHLVQELWHENIRIESVDSALTPYLNPETYDAYVKSLTPSKYQQSTEHVEREESESELYIHGGYGENLMQEVFRYARAAALIALDEQFDVIHVHDWMTYPAGIMAKMASGKPLIAHVHSLDVDRSGPGAGNQEVAKIEQAGLDAADIIVAVSHYTKGLVMKHYGIPEEKIRVVHNAVTRNEAMVKYHVPELMKNEKRVLFLGRITYQKGPDYFIEAARQVLQIVPNTRFIMAGTGDMMLNLVRRVGQLRMGQHFHFTGFMQREAIEHMFALSDLYVMPSVSEPFGITPLEAMASDVPVLISRQSGVSEVLSGAVKVDYWDVNEMANKICAVLKYPALARQVVKNCQEDLKKIKWENAAHQLKAIYNEAM
jgi:glycosyltransferase involved in cell wall biosynthesis